MTGLQFFRFAGKAPWQVTSRDADAWIQHLRETGAGENSINRKLAALSSFYQFVIDQFTFAGRDRRERALYSDAQGNARPNPFRKPERPKVDQYGHSQPVAVEAVRKVLKQLNRPPCWAAVTMPCCLPTSTPGAGPAKSPTCAGGISKPTPRRAATTTSGAAAEAASATGTNCPRPSITPS